MLADPYNRPFSWAVVGVITVLGLLTSRAFAPRWVVVEEVAIKGDRRETQLSVARVGRFPRRETVEGWSCRRRAASTHMTYAEAADAYVVLKEEERQAWIRAKEASCRA